MQLLSKYFCLFKLLETKFFSNSLTSTFCGPFSLNGLCIDNWQFYLLWIVCSCYKKRKTNWFFISSDNIWCLHLSQSSFKAYKIIQNQAEPFWVSSTGPPVEASVGERTRYQKSAAHPNSNESFTNGCPDNLVSASSWKLLGSEGIIGPENPKLSWHII